MYYAPPKPGVKLAFPSSLSRTVTFFQQVSLSSGTINTKGAWVEVETSTPHEVNGFHLIAYAVGASGSSRRALVDVGIGGAGSEVVLVPDILLSTQDNFGTMGGDMIYFPMRIPAGTRVAMRLQPNVAAITARGTIIFNYGESPTPVFTGCDALGVDTVTTNGVEISSGAAAYGAYTTITTLTRRYNAMLPLLGIGTTTATANSFIGVDVAVNRGTDVSVFRRGFRSKSVDMIVSEGNPMPFFGSFLLSDIMKVRLWSSAVVPFSVVLYGFY